MHPISNINGRPIWDKIAVSSRRNKIIAATMKHYAGEAIFIIYNRIFILLPQNPFERPDRTDSKWAQKTERHVIFGRV
jgi:hypothetical protein